MKQFDEDYESDAIDKCSRALSRLDDKAKIRVVRYLLDKFGLIAQASDKPQEVANTIIHNQHNNLVLAEPNESTSSVISHPQILQGGQIAIKDLLIKGLVKSEPDLIAVIGYYNSSLGKTAFTKQSILESFRENNIYTSNRSKNLAQNLASLIKKSVFSTITDEELAISEEGCEYAQNILNGNSSTKKRKPRSKKIKSSNTLENEPSSDERNEVDE